MRRPLARVRWRDVSAPFAALSLSWARATAGALCLGCSAQADVVAIQQSAPEAPELLSLSGDLEVSDPAAIFDEDTYWIFSSGSRLAIRVSNDLKDFRRLGDAFDALPAWVAEEVPDADSFWSPDVAFFGGRYHLYFAVSTVDSSQSCIGHATSERLGVAGSWLDDGPVICSSADSDWNAIDPSVLVEQDRFWLVMGSHRTGIKLIELDETGRRASSDLMPLAARPEQAMIQAPAISRRGDYYYLFASWNEGDDHRLMMGRASRVRGPYLDRDGLDLLEGGGSLLLESDEAFRGPGSNDVLFVGEQAYHFYDAYDVADDNRRVLRIATLSWERDWPLSAGP
jgi:arabinan endo-1,5-alpha-L-arabinosidase